MSQILVDFGDSHNVTTAGVSRLTGSIWRYVRAVCCSPASVEQSAALTPPIDCQTAHLAPAHHSEAPDKLELGLCLRIDCVPGLRDHQRRSLVEGALAKLFSASRHTFGLTHASSEGRTNDVLCEAVARSTKQQSRLGSAKVRRRLVHELEEALVRQ